MKKTKQTIPENAKQLDLEKDKSDAKNQFLTTAQGLKINDDNNTLKAGERGPSLLEDFILREKSRILITREFQKELFMLEVLRRMVILNCTILWKNIPKQVS